MSKFGFDTSAYKLSLVTKTTVQEQPQLADTALDYALRYAEIGWYVLPVRTDKKPLDGYGLNSATRDPGVIRKIWTQHPEAGIAVSCERSGLVVLDIDPRNGGDESLARLEAEHGLVYSAVVSQTQGGGEHRVFKAEPGASYPGTLGPGLDIKHRGYILVEPSRGEAGRYTWAAGRNPTTGTLPTDPPVVLRQRREPAENALSARTRPGSVAVAPQVYADLEVALKAIPPDAEYPVWFKVLQGLSRLGDTDRAYALALEWSTRSTKPGHTEAALRDKWRSCMREDYAVSHTSLFYLADQHDSGWRGRLSSTAADPSELNTFTLQPLTLEELAAARLHPRVVLPHMLYADVRTRIAAGGVGKTTIAMFEAVRLALGWELWGRTPERPVRTAFVTREDTREILVARMREIMRGLGLEREQVLQVLSNVQVVDLSGLPYRISEVHNDVVRPALKALEWLGGVLGEFKPDWLVMDPMVSFGVGEQRVNDAEQGLIEAMRILKARFDCCVEGIHHSGKANAREKTLDQYSGRGGSALSDGSRMVCVMQPLNPQEWLDATGQPLLEGESGLVMAMPKMSYCRPQPELYIKRAGYLFEAVEPLVAPPVAEVHKQIEASVYGVVHEAWLKNTPLSKEDLRADFSALFYGTLKRTDVLEALARLQRDGRVVQRQSRGGRGARAVLEPVVGDPEQTSQYALQDLPRLPRETPPGGAAG